MAELKIIINSELVETIFGALDNIRPEMLFNYAIEMKENAQDSIEWGIAESIIRFANYKKMIESATEVEGYAEAE